MRRRARTVEVRWALGGDDLDVVISCEVTLATPRPRWAHPADPQWDSEHEVEILGVREDATGRIDRPDLLAALLADGKLRREVEASAAEEAVEAEEAARSAADDAEIDRRRDDRLTGDDR